MRSLCNTQRRQNIAAHLRQSPERFQLDFRKFYGWSAQASTAKPGIPDIHGSDGATTESDNEVAACYSSVFAPPGQGMTRNEGVATDGAKVSQQGEN